MAEKFIRVTVSDAMSAALDELEDAEFDQVLDLISQLHDDIEEFCRGNASALSVIARAHPYVFICIRPTATSNEWVVVKIYEDDSPDDLPPGGGQGFMARRRGLVDAVFPELPSALRDLFRFADIVVEEPNKCLLPLAGTRTGIVGFEISGFRDQNSAYTKYSGKSLNAGISSIRHGFSIPAAPRSHFAIDALTAVIMPELSLLPLKQKSVPDPKAGHKCQPD